MSEKTFIPGQINCDDYKQSDFIRNDGTGLFDYADYFAEFVADAASKGYMVYGHPLTGAPGATFPVRNNYTGEEREFLNFCSYNYLGYSLAPEVIGAVQETVGRYGTGAVSAPMLSGYYDMTAKLEQAISGFKKKEAAVIFQTGYGTNLGTISALLRPGDVAVLDILAHASIYDGVKMSGADLKMFSHNNVKSLERVLKSLEGRRILVCVEGVYSMDGDIADLANIVEVSKRYGAKILIDEAHSSLIFGENGRGVAELFGVEDQIDLTIGTFSKAFGAIGGFCAGERNLVAFVKMNARPHIFSCSMAPHTAAGLCKVLELYPADGKARREKLWDNARYMLGQLKDAGFDTGETESQIIPVMVGDDNRLREISKRIFARGLYTGIVTYPAVSSKRTRLRLSVTAMHDKEQMDQAVEILKESFRD
ncbi:MAG: aminotransferase class I/II-fold pyridoxal phosphate-dependent enzyme [Oscillospiraceae bacterium]|nr:aminotransferase class I/II-fold pyridoxal phosphate-dependent enzyme [Oscillospiraceae bacterium]